MRAQQVFMESLLAHGVDSVFGNPGTTENSLLDRLGDYPQIGYYVVLHEGVAVGAANYYAQATGKTPVVNLHVAPGLGNAIGMMYGALKVRAPMLVTAGQQDTRLQLREPLLSHDLVAMAAPVTKWSAEPRAPDEVAPMLRRAFQIAGRPPAGPVFVSLPVNVMEGETGATHTAPARLHAAVRRTPTGSPGLSSCCAEATRPPSWPATTSQQTARLPRSWHSRKPSARRSGSLACAPRWSSRAATRTTGDGLRSMRPEFAAH